MKRTRTRKPPPPAGIEDEPLPDDMLARMRPAHEVLPDLLNAVKKRGRPTLDHPKVAVKLRIDQDVVDAYRATGAGWQTRMNGVLRDHAPRRRKRAGR